MNNKLFINAMYGAFGADWDSDMDKNITFLYRYIFKYSFENVSLEDLYNAYLSNMRGLVFENIDAFKDSVMQSLINYIGMYDNYGGDNIRIHASVEDYKNLAKRISGYTDEELDIYIKLS